MQQTAHSDGDSNIRMRVMCCGRTFESLNHGVAGFETLGKWHARDVPGNAEQRRGESVHAVPEASPQLHQSIAALCLRQQAAHNRCLKACMQHCCTRHIMYVAYAAAASWQVASQMQATQVHKKQ